MRGGGGVQEIDQIETRSTEALLEQRTVAAYFEEGIMLNLVICTGSGPQIQITGVLRL